MADILIKGMETPKDCEACQFKLLGVNGILYWCSKDKTNCPLIEVEEYQAVNDKTGEVKKCWAEVENGRLVD